MNYYDRDIKALVGILIACFVALVLLLGHQHDDFKAVCHEQGGHWYQPYDSAILCLTDDNRIIEVST